MQARTTAGAASRIECALQENPPLRLLDAADRRVQCLAGVAWITAYGERQDVFLKPGETYVVPNGGLVLIEAVGRCRISVDLPGTFDYRDEHGLKQWLQGWARVLIGGRQSAVNTS